jgi:hypothetical protein
LEQIMHAWITSTNINFEQYSYICKRIVMAGSQ